MVSAEWNFEEEDLEAMARLGNEAVLCKEILADLLTPLAAFLRVAEMDKQSFLLESVEAGVTLARYSFMGSGAVRVYRIRHGRLSVEEGQSQPRLLDGPPGAHPSIGSRRRRAAGSRPDRAPRRGPGSRRTCEQGASWKSSLMVPRASGRAAQRAARPGDSVGGLSASVPVPRARR